MYFSTYRHKILCIFLDSKQILVQNYLVDSKNYRESLNEKNPKILILSYTQFSEKFKFQLKFSKICIF